MRIAILSHGHPLYTPGGGEHAAYALYQALDAQIECTASFWAAAPTDLLDAGEQVRCLKPEREFLLRGGVDPLLLHSALQLCEHSPVAVQLRMWRPDVIHAHHVLGIGLDFFWALKRWLPDVPIVYTLHEFLLICPYHGQFLRRDGATCDQPDLDICSSCLPDVPVRNLWIRRGMIEEWVSLIDRFISPSHQLAVMMCKSGLLNRNRVDVIDNLLPASISVFSDRGVPDVNRFAIFGNLTRSKGLDLVLKAVLLAKEQGAPVRLTIFGPVEKRRESLSAEDEHYQDLVKRLLSGLNDCVTVSGVYRQQEIPELMASVAWVLMGSRWRENAPVVIEEALACGRPLLVPGLGGMAEKVRDGLDGLHYKPGSALSLAELLIRCSYDQAGWTHLTQTLRQPTSTLNVLDAHRDLYSQLVLRA